MKEICGECLASNPGRVPYAGEEDVTGVASVRGNAGQPLSSDIINSACRSCSHVEKMTPPLPQVGEAVVDTAESETLSMGGHPKRENQEIPFRERVDSIVASGNPSTQPARS